VSSTVSAAVTAAASELLQQDAQPLLDALISEVNAAASKFVSALPAGVQGSVGLGVNLLMGLGSIAAQAELNTILAHNPAPALPAPVASQQAAS
jgi:hypothetical protein